MVLSLRRVEGQQPEYALAPSYWDERGEPRYVVLYERGTQMTNLEMTKLCAKAMGFAVDGSAGILLPWRAFDPLHDDAQSMALVKKFRLCVDGADKSGEWSAREWASGTFALDADLNRAIVECVAKMQQAVS